MTLPTLLLCTWRSRRDRRRICDTGGNCANCTWHINKK